MFFRKTILLAFVIMAIAFCFVSFENNKTSYSNLYFQQIHSLKNELQNLENDLQQKNILDVEYYYKVREARVKMKSADIWLRYFQPNDYKKINGQLPVEWESEVFEKFEKPYRRLGSGLYLAQQYVQQNDFKKDSLLKLIQTARKTLDVYLADSTTKKLNSPAEFYFANRLMLLNLASIYTTGFENDNSSSVIQELAEMLTSTKEIYATFDESFPQQKLDENYLKQFNLMIDFVEKQSYDLKQFNHYQFIKTCVNPLFAMNQKMIRDYHLQSKSTNDFSLNNDANSIFDKHLFEAQNTKGVFAFVENENDLNKIKTIGEKLFQDPILSGNNSRSCASCHKPNEFFTNTELATALHFNDFQFLPRNIPSLINVQFYQLLMHDGKHFSLMNQAKDVITNPVEMNGDLKLMMKKILSCEEYEKAFKKFLKFTPEYNSIEPQHIISALMIYYTQYSYAASKLDDAMNSSKEILDENEVAGFNLFMGKAQCGTCHFVPMFSGIKPPFVSSEFEIVGTPTDKKYSKLSDDSGRYKIFRENENLFAFRTPTLRNVTKTKPYMHNGVFTTLDEVIDFYNAGGGYGKGIRGFEPTLSIDSLHLSTKEISQLKSFLKTIDENISIPYFQPVLPFSKIEKLNARKVGGAY